MFAAREKQLKANKSLDRTGYRRSVSSDVQRDERLGLGGLARLNRRVRKLSYNFV